jgi:hypothetical protein
MSDATTVIQDAAQFLGRAHFQDADLSDWPNLADAAKAALMERPYDPQDTTFLGSVRTWAEQREPTMRQLRAVANALLQQTNVPAAAEAPETTVAAQSASLAARPGFYTVVCDDGSHVTLRLEKHPFNEAQAEAGVLVAGYLSGSDNESAYTRFAFVNPNGRLGIWRKTNLNEGSRPVRALRFLLELSTDAQNDAGMAYALESNNCRRCGRKLTVPASICRGLGPICEGRE